MTHQLAIPAPNFDRIMRARILQALRDQGISMSDAARRLGVPRSTLYRRLRFDSDDPVMYRRLHTTDVDELLQALGLDPEVLLVPALGDEMVQVLQFARYRQSEAAEHARLADTDADTRELLHAAADQGLVVMYGDPDDPDTWYARLTTLGLTALGRRSVPLRHD